MVITLFIAALLQTQAAPRLDRNVPADARAEIARADSDWLPAMERQDAKAITEPYADDGVFVAATGESVKGRAAIEQLMRERFSRTGHVTGGTLQQDDLVAAGSMIYEWGHADVTVAGARGEAPSHSVGRYLTVWKRDAAGRWRIIRNLSLGQ